jgi:hypothetical protein
MNVYWNQWTITDAPGYVGCGEFKEYGFEANETTAALLQFP